MGTDSKNKLLPSSTETSEKSENWNFDHVFPIIGQCGNLQLFYYVLLAFSAFNVGSHGMAPIFTHKVPQEVVTINGTRKLIDLTPENCRTYHNGTDPENSHLNSENFNFTINGAVIVSVITEYQLVCDELKIQQSEMAATVFFFGQATASLVAGLIGDNFGRKLPVLMFGILVTFASLLASYTTNYTIYSALKSILIPSLPKRTF